MLSEYEASTLAKTKPAGINTVFRRPAEPNRIGVALVALSLLSALALLYSAWFDWTPGPRTARAVPVSTIAGPTIHPAISGLPEAAIFMRHPPGDSGGVLDKNLAAGPVLRTGTSAR